MGRRALTAIAVLGVLGVLVAACDEPEPRLADPTTSAPATGPTSDTPEPSPTETVTSEPPEPETAQEFLRRWQDAANQMQVSGDSETFRSLNDKCISCNTFADRIDMIYRRGGSIATNGSRILDIVRWGKINDWPTYDVRVQSAPTTVIESASDDPESLPGGKQTFRVSVEKRGLSWVVRKYGRVVYR